MHLHRQELLKVVQLALHAAHLHDALLLLLLLSLPQQPMLSLHLHRQEPLNVVQLALLAAPVHDALLMRSLL
jgi:hypothetical protein